MPARASYYVVRPGPTSRLPSGLIVQEPGRLVPLIAVDQLPDWLEVVGVPRQLPFAQAPDMIAIGAVSRPSDFQIHDTAAGCEHDRKLHEAGNDDDVYEVRVLHNGALRGGGLVQQNPSSVSTGLDRVSDTTAPPTVLSARWPLVNPSFLQSDEAQTEETTKRPRAKNTSPPSKAATSGPNSRPSSMPISRPTGNARLGPASDSSVADGRQLGKRVNIHNKAWSRDVSISSWGRVPITVRTTNAPKAAKASKAPNAQKTPKAPDDALGRQHCWHWCQTGSCSFKSSCRYLHGMPTTTRGLRKVGLCRLPAWWLDKEEAAVRAACDNNCNSGNERGGVNINSNKEKSPSCHTTVSGITVPESCGNEELYDTNHQSDKGWDIALGDIDAGLSKRSSTAAKSNGNEFCLSSEAPDVATPATAIPYCENDDAGNLLNL